MTYAGLTIADKEFLLKRKNERSIGWMVYLESVGSGVNIDEALTQIAEMETAQAPDLPPLTWNERINQMTAEEKAEFFDGMFVCVDGLNRASAEHCGMRTCKRCWIEKLTSDYYSPYTEGEKK